MNAKPVILTSEVHVYRDGATQFRLSIEPRPDVIDVIMSPSGPPPDPTRVDAFVAWRRPILHRLGSDPRPCRILRTDTGERIFIGDGPALILFGDL